MDRNAYGLKGMDLIERGRYCLSTMWRSHLSWGSRENSYLRWHGTSFSRLMPPDRSESGWIFRQHWRWPRQLSGYIVQPWPLTHARHLQGAGGKPQSPQTSGTPKVEALVGEPWTPRSMTHHVGNHITDIYYSGPTKTIPLKEFVVCP